jgi:hypothetical protein
MEIYALWMLAPCKSWSASYCLIMVGGDVQSPTSFAVIFRGVAIVTPANVGRVRAAFAPPRINRFRPRSLSRSLDFSLA